MVARYSLICLLAIFLFGCSSASPSPTSAPVTEATLTPKPSATPAPTTAPEYVSRIRNAQYQLGISDGIRSVPLTDGKFEQGTVGGADYISALVCLSFWLFLLM
jgi:hypothetical protein